MPPASKPETDRDVVEAERLCRRRAMDLLARRDHSRFELARKLERGFDAALAERVLDGLADDGLLVEARFVESFIRARARKGQGPRRIRGELAERGIADGSVSVGLADADCDWSALAAEVRAKRFGAAPPADFRERARQAKFLQYRGFDAEQIRAALKAAGDAGERAGDAPFDRDANR